MSKSLKKLGVGQAVSETRISGSFVFFWRESLDFCNSTVTVFSNVHTLAEGEHKPGSTQALQTKSSSRLFAFKITGHATKGTLQGWHMLQRCLSRRRITSFKKQLFSLNILALELLKEQGFHMKEFTTSHALEQDPSLTHFTRALWATEIYNPQKGEKIWPVTTSMCWKGLPLPHCLSGGKTLLSLISRGKSLLH